MYGKMEQKKKNVILIKCGPRIMSGSIVGTKCEMLVTVPTFMLRLQHDLTLVALVLCMALLFVNLSDQGLQCTEQ